MITNMLWRVYNLSKAYNGLYSRLVEDDRIEDLKRATREPEYLQQLMTEYDIHPHK